MQKICCSDEIVNRNIFLSKWTSEDYTVSNVLQIQNNNLYDRIQSLIM